MKTRHSETDKIHVITLGCSKNTVDSEKLITQLSANNLKIEHNATKSNARNIIINTCGFINDAKQESIDTILEFANAKTLGKIDKLYVVGCLSERYANDLRNEIPEVDQFFGVNNIQKIVEGIGYNYRDHLIGERSVSNPKHYAYLKISEGCDRVCSYCAIPLIRGKHKSIATEELLKEATSLSQKGVKELILIAQDLSYYGRDLYHEPRLPQLINDLSLIDGIEWIRLHYLYPAGFPFDILSLMSQNKKICHYIDMPLQHISNNMLKHMRRGISKEKTLELIDNIREWVPDVALRTTLLTGHPGETIEDFEELLAFVESAKFDRLGVFPYSHEEDTHAFKTMKDDISDEVKSQRVSLLMETQQKISKQLNLNKIGKTFKTIVDRIEGDYYIGRTEFDSPEVDNEVLINKESGKVKIGEFVNVKIIDANEFDLIGNLIK